MSDLKPLFTWRTAIAKSNLPPNARLVALTLSLHMSELGDRAFPSLETQASETGLARSTVARWLKYLESNGWLARSPGGGRGNRTTYQAAVPSDGFRQQEKTVREENRPTDDAKQSESGPLNSPTVGPELDIEHFKNSSVAAAPQTPNGNGGNGGGKRRRDELFETVVIASGWDLASLTTSERGRVAQATKQLRETGRDPEWVKRFTGTWYRTYPDASLTPQAIIRNASDFDAGKLDEIALDHEERLAKRGRR